MDWIYIHDELPDDGARVLVYTEYPVYGSEKSYRRGITIAKFRDGKFECENFIGNRVIAWMPLPKKPEEG